MKTLTCTGHIKSNYPLHISTDQTFVDLFDELPNVKNAIVVIDKVIIDLFPSLASLCRERGMDMYVVSATESDKSWQGLEQLLDHSFARHLSRDDIIVAIGGGVVMNLAGLAGSLIMRGIRFYYVPTTLTGQIDACMGSKQAVNYKGAKNWVGLFNDPEFCYINPTFLAQLPDHEIRSQAIEGFKLCLATNQTLYEEYQDLARDFKAADFTRLSAFIEDMIQVKLPIVEADMTEENYGMSLLYGHTLGHAIEMLDHERISHGEGVGLGMLAAARISEILGIGAASLVGVHEDLLRNLGLPLKIPAHIAPDAIYDMLAHNKKNYAGEVRFILLSDVGKMAVQNGKYYRTVPRNIIMQAIQEGY